MGVIPTVPIPNEAVAFLLPVAIEVIMRRVEMFNKAPLTEADRTVVSFIICFFLSIIFNFDALALGSIREFLQSFTVIFTISYAMFKLYWKNSYFRGKLQDKYYGNPNAEEEREPESMGKVN